MQNKSDNTKFDKVLKGNRVTVKEHENINQALRRFKKKVEASGTLEDIRKKEFYEKPTTERKRKKGAAKARWKKKLREQQLPPKLF
jgi:small subunit ribosomal protein S21